MEHSIFAYAATEMVVVAITGLGLASERLTGGIVMRHPKVTQLDTTGRTYWRLANTFELRMPIMRTCGPLKMSYRKARFASLVSPSAMTTTGIAMSASMVLGAFAVLVSITASIVRTLYSQ